MSRELWAPVVGYEGLYEVSTLGRVRSLERFSKQRFGNLQHRPERVLRPINDHTSTKYLYVNLSKNGRSKKFAIHRLVLEAFIGPCPSANHQACHNDGCRTNPRLDNLRWDTIKANAADVERHGNRVRGEQSPRAKLTAQQVNYVLSCHESSLKLSRALGVASSTIRAIRIGQNWKHMKTSASKGAIKP